MSYVATALVTVAIGFTVGFAVSKKAIYWCKTCGGQLRCADCMRRAGIYRSAGL